MLNPAGTDAQFERSRCSISRGILSHCLGIHTVLVQLADHLSHILLAQRVHRDAALIQPGLELGHGIRVFQPGQLMTGEFGRNAL